MNKHQLYESIMAKVAIEVKKAINEEFLTTHRGRPSKQKSITNLYPTKVSDEKEIEKYIRAYAGIGKGENARKYYMDNKSDIRDLRDAYINAIDMLISKNKLDKSNRSEYIEKLNLNDLLKFKDDILLNYKKLVQCPNFPKSYILLDSPAKKKIFNKEEKKLIRQFKNENKSIDCFGESVENLTLQELKKLAKVNTDKSSGIQYVVCRPVKRKEINYDVPHIIYCRNSKSSMDVNNALRCTYTYDVQNMGYDVEYLYTSPLQIEKYLIAEYNEYKKHI